MKRLFCALLLASLGTSTFAAQSAKDLAQATIVVYNRKAPDSIALAYFYAKARQIPSDHLVGLECATEEEISRQEYDETIAEPLRARFADQKWWTLRTNADDQPVVSSSRIHFVALIRGLPLKIRATVTDEGDHPPTSPIGGENKASVDSELAMLGLFSHQIAGAANNPYFQSFRPITELGVSPLLLVCRLDGPSEAIVRRMIIDAAETEKNGLWGRAYVDGSDHTSGGMADGDRWMKAVTKDLRRVGVPVVYDTESAVFPSGFPINDCALYYGWYAGGVSGPFADPGFRFLPGAVAVHIHSFSASTLRSADSNWVAPLLGKGAAASLGNVYEPYLQLTTHLDIFNDRLLHGFTFAESAWMGSPALSWMNVAVGDPLYRPYANWLQIETKGDEREKSAWRMYHEFAVANTELEPADYLTKARAVASRADNGPMIEDLGLMEKESGDFESAISYLRQARSLYTKPDDILRAALEQADASLKAGDKKSALALARSLGRLVPPEAPAATLLKKIENQINPPPPTPKPNPSP
jgi:uncharacterized protein (TIGR03790 family)